MIIDNTMSILKLVFILIAIATINCEKNLNNDVAKNLLNELVEEYEELYYECKKIAN